MELGREAEAGELDLEDPQLEEKLVNELKAQGVFDLFRKDCLSDVDTKPAYQNLRVRVDKSVSSYLSKTTWRPTLNKNQLRNQLRKYIQEMSGVEAGVDRIVDQIVNPKLNTTFMPEVENVIYKYFGTSKPEEGEDMVNGNNFDDENSQNLPNGDSYDDVGGKISTRNLSTISSDAEMLNFDANSVGSSPGPGLAGNVSPLTPGGSPKVNQGDISPLTPSATPPPPASNTEPENMELSHSHEDPMQMETPPPPPPGEELKIEEIVTMEVDTEEMSRPQSAYTPPLPPANNTHHSTPEKSYTPPLPMMFPPHPPTHQPSGPSSPHTPPLPPLPRDVRGDDSGGDASMSSISDTDLGDISPPRQRKQESAEGFKKDGDTASDISEEELRLDSEALEGSKDRDSDNVTPDKDSDEDLQQLEKMKAELMAQLEGDFKLSPEESDSDGEDDNGGAAKDSPTSPDHSSTSRSVTPAAKQPSPSSTNSSPTNQLQRVRNLPLPTPDYSNMTPAQRIKALPLPGEESSDRARSQSGPLTPEDLIHGPISPPGLVSGPRTPPGPLGRSPSLSPSPPPSKRGPQTPPSPPSAFSSRPPILPASPPRESLSKLDLNDPQTVTPTCKPISSERSRSPGPDGDMGGSGGSSSTLHAPPVAGLSSSQEGSRSTTTSTGSSDQKTPVNKSSHTHSSSRSHHHSSKHHSSSSSKHRRSDKKLDKIKEQTKAKIEKYEQKIKSKDTIKSDKFQALDIFSTTKKPATPHLPHRIPKIITSGSNTPSTPKPMKDFEKKLAESIRKEVERREEEKERRRKEEEKNKSFKMPVKLDDRRRSSSGEKIKERRSSKDDKKDSSRSKDKERVSHDKDRKDRKRSISSSSSKERRSSEDDKKESKGNSKYDKEREKQALESKKRLQEAREKKEREEKEKKRQKDKERREKEKKVKDEKEREGKKDKVIEKIKEKSKSEIKDVLKEKIGTLGIDNIQKMLMESLAEKTGAKFSEDEKKDMIKKLEGLIQKKKIAKESPKKYVDPESSEDEKPVKKVSPAKKNKIEDSSESSSSDFDSDSEGDQKIKEIKNRIRERRKSGESGEQSPKRTRPVRNKSTKTVKIESELSDTDGDFVIREEILERAPNPPQKSVETPVKVENKKLKVEPKVETLSKAIAVKKPASKASKVKPTTKKVDIDPEVEDLSAFSQSDVDFMFSIKEKYDSLLKDEDNLSVSSVTSEELNAAIPSSRTVVIDAGPKPEETVRIMKQFGGNPRLFTPVPEWLHPYLLGAKVRLEDVGMPTKQEISDYIQNKQTKSKKRGSGWDIVVEWVPTGPPMAKKSKLEKQLGFDMDSSFGQTVALSGGKRTRRANMKYSDTDFTSEEDPSIKQGLEINSSLANFGSSAVDQPNHEQDLPNPAPAQPFHTVRTHKGSAQTPKRGGKGRKESLVVRRVEPSIYKDELMDIETGKSKDVASEEKSEEAKDSPDSPPSAEDRAEIISPANPVMADNTPASEETSPGKKRRSKDIIAAYLTSAGVERADQSVTDKVEIVGDVNDATSEAMEVAKNEVDISSNSSIAVIDGDGDKEGVVAMLDAEISAADEELNSVLKNLKRKRSTSGDSKFHGWAVHTIAVPRTALSTMLESAGAELAQLETAGARLGMTDIDCLLSLKEVAGESLLEVVMSPPIQSDIKKVESMLLPCVSGVKPIGKAKEAGAKGKLSDSDSDERGEFKFLIFNSQH